MPPYLHSQSVEVWEKYTEPYVKVVTNGLENQNILAEFFRKGNIDMDVKYLAKEKSDIIVLYKGSIKERFGLPKPLFTTRDGNETFKLLESDHDIEFIPDAPVSYERPEEDEETYWLKVVPVPTEKEMMRLIPMLGNKQLGDEVSSRHLHDIMREHVIKVFARNPPKNYLNIVEFTCERKPFDIGVKDIKKIKTSHLSEKVIIKGTGPAQNVKIMDNEGNSVEVDIDFLTTLPMRQWPKQASNFLTRKRTSGWPSRSNLEYITQFPVTLGASYQGYQNNNKDFLLCFGHQYVYLAEVFPSSARCLYMALKALYKKELVKIFSGLQSHTFRVAFMWFMEEHYSQEWTNEGELYKIFSHLKDYVSDMLINGRINHYFIDELNILNLEKDQFGKTAKDMGVYLKDKKVDEGDLDPYFKCMNDDCNDKKFFNFKFEKSLQDQGSQYKLPEILLRVVISSCIRKRLTAEEEKIVPI